MKEDQLREHAKCDLCGKGIGASGLPLFYVVRIERHGLKLDAIQRQTGLAMMLGGHAGLARVMGPDEEMTEPLMEPEEITICENCGNGRTVEVAGLAWIACNKREKKAPAQ